MTGEPCFELRPHMCERAREWGSLRLDGELSELERVLLDAHLVALRGLCRLRASRSTAITETIRACSARARCRSRLRSPSRAAASRLTSVRWRPPRRPPRQSLPSPSASATQSGVPRERVRPTSRTRPVAGERRSPQGRTSEADALLRCSAPCEPEAASGPSAASASSHASYAHRLVTTGGRGDYAVRMTIFASPITSHC